MLCFVRGSEIFLVTYFFSEAFLLNVDDFGTTVFRAFSVVDLATGFDSYTGNEGLLPFTLKLLLLYSSFETAKTDTYFSFILP